jgi:hypothetical protein
MSTRKTPPDVGRTRWSLLGEEQEVLFCTHRHRTVYSMHPFRPYTSSVDAHQGKKKRVSHNTHTPILMEPRWHSIAYFV